jgi:hypothetical protein
MYVYRTTKSASGPSPFIFLCRVRQSQSVGTRLIVITDFKILHQMVLIISISVIKKLNVHNEKYPLNEDKCEPIKL